MLDNKNNNPLVLGLDISTKTIGVALFEDLGSSGTLKLLHHVTPIVKPRPTSKMQELCDKARMFEEEFLTKYADFGIETVIIEEPLLRSNNVNTVGTLLRFNGIISRSIYEILGIVPEYISSYDSRKYAFPELIQPRTHDKQGNAYTEKQMVNNRKTPVLFGAYQFDADKKMIILEKVADLEPQIVWAYTKNQTPKKENFDMADAYSSVIGYMRKIHKWN